MKLFQRATPYILALLLIVGVPALAAYNQDLPAGAKIGGHAIAALTNTLGDFAATTSAQLRGVLSDETGTGAAVFAVSPVFTTPNIGTATGSVTGNAATATTLATPRTINGTSFDGSSNITVTAAAGTLTGSSLSSGVTGSSLTSVGTLGTLTVTAPIVASVTGNAATATTLATPRTINGTSFDGSANITVPAAAGTLTGSTLAAGVTGSSLTGLGTIATGTWQGTAIGDTYIASASTWNGKQAPLPAGTTTTVLHGNASGSPSYSAVNLATDTTGNLNLATNSTGVLAAAQGGAGANNGILKANGSGTTSAATVSTDYLSPSVAAAISGQYYIPPATLTDASTVTWNLNTQQVAILTLTGDHTIGAATNLHAGSWGLIYILEDGTGGHALSFDTSYKFQNGGVIPNNSTGAGALDIFVCVSKDGTSMDCNLLTNFQ